MKIPAIFSIIEVTYKRGELKLDYGKKISYLKKSHGMTQDELGKALNVTYQAVSKWERGESQPDFTTMTQIAKIFQVPIDYFVEGGENFQEPVHNNVITEANNFVGLCTECGKMLKEEEIFTSSPKIICKSCAERLEQNELKAKKEKEDRERYRREREKQIQLGSGFDVKLVVSLLLSLASFIWLAVLSFTSDFSGDGSLYSALMFVVPLALFGCTHAVFDFINDLRLDNDDGPEGYKRNLSLIVGGVFAGLYLIIFLVLYLTSHQAFYIGMLFISVIVSFTFVSQYMWGSVVREIFTAGGFTFKLPGFIFSLSVDSILLMLVLKLFLGILAAVIFVATTVLLALVAIFGSVFTFVPCIIYKSVKDKKA